MERPSSTDLFVVSVERVGDDYVVVICDAGHELKFTCRFEEAHGIRVLEWKGPLSVWLGTHGKLWALSPIRDVIDAVSSGAPVEFPTKLASPP